ncbi:hypothetical protein Nmel_011012 [Mimus melanotis]
MCSDTAPMELPICVFIKYITMLYYQNFFLSGWYVERVSKSKLLH